MLAAELEIPERTLRRAAGEGLLRGKRLSARRFRTTLREEAYLRSHWPLVSELRSALRTEPNVALAVLFGSVADGTDHQRSDVDLLVTLRNDSVARLADLAGRLSDHTGRSVQLVRLADGLASPPLMADVLERGRVLCDREHVWPEMISQAERWRRRARHVSRTAATPPTIDELGAAGIGAPSRRLHRRPGALP
jgi:predicted nucleotidyltransferase